MVAVGAGLGMRQGEFLGLSPDDIDWLRGIVNVQRQVKVLERKPIFALPKGQKTREVPLPESVKVALAEHLRKWPARPVTLPLRTLDGEPTEVNLMFTSPTGRAVHRDRFNSDIWHAALEKVGIPRGRENGMHALRHWYASTLLTQGESVKAVSEWLGHHNAAYTLGVYVHLMPASEQRMRTLIDGAWRPQDQAPDGPATAPGVSN